MLNTLVVAIKEEGSTEIKDLDVCCVQSIYRAASVGDRLTDVSREGRNTQARVFRNQYFGHICRRREERETKR